MSQIMRPLEKVEQAFLQFVYATKLMTYCELGKINKAEFDGEVAIRLESRTFIMRANSFNTYDDLIIGAHNNFQICLGFLFITLDEVLSQIGLKKGKTPEYPDKELRNLVFALRCAFAHNMLTPQWKAGRSLPDVIKVNINGYNIYVDLGKLDGKNFSYDDIGGAENIFLIKEAVEDVIRRNQPF